MYMLSSEDQRIALELVRHPGFQILEDYISDKIEEEDAYSEQTITKLPQVWEAEEHKGAKKALKTLLPSFLDFVKINPINTEE